MSANKSGRRDQRAEVKERSAQEQHNPGCELAMNKLAIDPSIVLAIKVLPQLCPRCAQNLRELITTQGLGLARLKADLAFAIKDNLDVTDYRPIDERHIN